MNFQEKSDFERNIAYCQSALHYILKIPRDMVLICFLGEFW